MPAFLRRLGDREKASRYRLPTDRPILIGRGEGCDLRIDNKSLSRLHCSIELEADGWHLVDCKSTNGTRIDGFKVSDTRIHSGEIIQIGEIRLEFVNDESGAAMKSPSPLLGRHFGRFELLRRIHSETSGTLFHARDSERNCDVALRIFAPDWTIDEQAAKRFEKSPLQHPGIVQLFSTGRTESQAWVSTEWVDGPSLRDLLSGNEPMPAAEAARIIHAVAVAADAAARQGIVHGRVKPSNILIDANGNPKLNGFVSVKNVKQVADSEISSTGQLPPDFHYRAPESFREPCNIDCRADVYSLGACLLQMVTGQPPPRALDLDAAIDDAVTNSARPAQLPPELRTIMQRCLAADPASRFDTPGRLAEALRTSRTTGDSPHPPAAPETRNVVELELPSASEIETVDPLTSAQEEPVSLPSGAVPANSTWRHRVFIIPKPSNAPAERPWLTLLATIAIVVSIGSLVLFREPLFDRLARKAPSDAQPAADSDTNPIKETNVTRGGESPAAVTDPGPSSRKDPSSDLERLVVEPGAPLRNVGDAVEIARDGQIIEVATNDAFRGEVKLAGKTITLIANPSFRPIFRNTIRIAGGGTVRIEGFHFEPYAADKPAIEVESMPQKLEIAGCTFRGVGGVLILVQSRSVSANTQRSVLLMERSFAAGNVLFGFDGLPPDVQLTNTCLVGDQAVIEWQLSAADSVPAARWALQLQNNTIVARSVLHVRLNDQQKAVVALPQSSIRLNDNIIAFPSHYPGTFFRWEAWQKPDIPKSRFAWSGSNNTFSGLGPWSMATTLALSDPAATAQVAMDLPDQWQAEWASQVTNIFTLPPEFRRAGPTKSIQQVVPADYELVPDSRQLKMGSDNQPLGADIRSLPSPPPINRREETRSHETK